jgi:uncharacterized protein (DUF58 family)
MGQGPDSIVDGEFLSKLNRLSLALGRDLIHGLMGEHQAVRRTAGIEFADYRPYSPGDDLRRVDWNAYARLGTLQVREAQAEHDTVLYLLVDASPSMDFGVPSKFFTARRLAAALGYVALSHLDSLVIATPGVRGQGLGVSARFKGRAEAGSLFRELQELRVGEVAPFDNVLAGWTAVSSGHTAGRIAVVISDLLLDEYREGIRQLVAVGFQVTALHVLSPEEIAPPDEGDLELIDSETGERLEIHLGPESMTEYRRRLDEWLLEAQSWCRSQGAGYLLVRSDWDVERVMLQTLRQRGVTA